MFDSNFLDRVCAGVPKHHLKKFLKYALIIGVDKLSKKGFMKEFDFEVVKNYTCKVNTFIQARIKGKGRVGLSRNDGQLSIKREIQNLKHEINNLAKNLEHKHTKITESTPVDSQMRSSSTKNKRPNNKPNRKEDSRKRAASFDHKRHQAYDRRFDEVTPKVTEVTPNQIFQNFNINISKHHLDDTEIKEVFKNQVLLNQTSEQKKKTQPSKPRSMVNKSFAHVPSPIPPKSSIHPRNHIDKENRPHQMPDPQKIKEIYEQDLRNQLQNHNRSTISNPSGQMNNSRSDSNKSTVQHIPKTKPQTKKIQYDPHANVNDLPYIQVQPQSKVKEEIAQARKRHLQQLQNSIHHDQQWSEQEEQEPERSDNVLNTANFSRKQVIQEHPQPPKHYQQPSHKLKDDPIYKSTVTTVLNDDNSETAINRESAYDQEYDSSNQEREQFSDPGARYLHQGGQISSSQYSQQQTKRSQLSKDEQVSRPPAQFQDTKSRDRQQIDSNVSRSKSSQLMNNLQPQTQIEYPSFYPQQQSSKYVSRDLPKKQQTQQSYDMSSQKVSVQLSGQKQSSVWDRGSRQQQRVNPFVQPNREDDYNRSSVSSNFSMFTPDDELKNFFQKDFIERKMNVNHSSEINSKQSLTSSSQQSESMQNAMHFQHQNQLHEEQQWFKKRSHEANHPQNEEVGKSNVFNNNRLSVTRILNSTQF